MKDEKDNECIKLEGYHSHLDDLLATVMEGPVLHQDII